MISSPCVSRCRIDPSGDYCTGCGRLCDEIAVWRDADEATQRVILARARQRLTEAAQRR